MENKKLLALGLPTSHEQLRQIRQIWEERANEHLARASLELRVDHRSHAERGLEIEPAQHVGVHATQMERRGNEVSWVRLDEDVAKRNSELIREKPDQVLTLITREKSVFYGRDVARTLHRYIDSAEESGPLSPKSWRRLSQLVELQAEQRHLQDKWGHTIEQARYSTQEMVGIERDMAASADRLAAGRGFGVASRHLCTSIGKRLRHAARRRPVRRKNSAARSMCRRSDP